MNTDDYRSVLSHFVDEDYVNMIDEDAFNYAINYCEEGGSPAVCVGLGLAETENLGWSFEKIASELDTSRRSIYNARKDLGLVEKDVRGMHVD